MIVKNFVTINPNHEGVSSTICEGGIALFRIWSQVNLRIGKIFWVEIHNLALYEVMIMQFHPIMVYRGK